MDPAKIEAAITAKTKAIVPVHIGGHPADLDGVIDVAKRHGIPVLEDACQAWGAAWKGTPVGAIGDLGCFSFQASKNINAGEGGIVVTNSRDHYERVWSLHNVGRLPEGGWYQHEILGRNLRMAEWNAAVLIAQFERLPGMMATRQRNAARLIDGLADVPGLNPTKVDERVTSHGWHLFQIRYDPTAFGGKDRGSFIAALTAEGVPCSAGYVPLTRQNAIQTTLRERFGADALANLAEVPNADFAGDHTIWLQQTLLLADDPAIDDIVAACAKIQRAWAG
jgi:dTDP-4-amino-4,6-dideoxygalactose transaminase